MTSRIVVGYIPTEHGEAAVDHAIAEARRRDGELVIVNSMEGDEPGERFVRIREALDGLGQRLDETGVAYTIHDVARGQSPAQDVIQTVDENDADLVVIGIRRRTAVGKLVLGSNAAEILMRSPCPVLAVKPGSPAP